MKIDKLKYKAKIIFTHNLNLNLCNIFLRNFYNFIFNLYNFVNLCNFNSNLQEKSKKVQFVLQYCNNLMFARKLFALFS